MINTARRTLYIWVGLTLLFTFGIFAPSIFGMDGFDGGFAISFVCIVLALTGVVVVFMYMGRARAADKILGGDSLLARWRYDNSEWQNYSEADYRMERSDKFALFRLVMVITAVVTFGFFLFHRDSALLMVGIFLGLGVILSATILLTTSYDRWQNKRYPGDVFIARDGAYVGRKLHLWKGWGATLDDLSYDEEGRMLFMSYSMPSRTGRDSATVRIPVPQGQEDKARQVLAELGRVVTRTA